MTHIDHYAVVYEYTQRYGAAMGDKHVSIGEAVEAAIKKGWQPFGGPFVSHDQDGIERIGQAMVSYMIVTP